jgi:hypothetical protein
MGGPQVVSEDILSSITIPAFSANDLYYNLYPYVMSWPSSLLGNYGMFAVLQDDDPSSEQGVL